MVSGPSSEAQLLARLHDLELRSRAVADSLMPGRHRHPRPGWSIEFSQHREYSPGDDLRHVDWKATARSDRLLLRRYQDETALVAWLVVDATPSMAYHGARSDRSKLEYVSLLASALAWVVIRQRDAIGLCVVTEQGNETLPPSDEPSHWHAITRRLAELNAGAGKACSNKDAWSRGLTQFASQVSSGSVAMVLSDWVDDTQALRSWLQLLRDARRVDLRVLQCLDPDEMDLGNLDATHFEMLEGAYRVAADTERLQEAYRSEVVRAIAELQALFRSFSVPFVSCLTSTDAVSAIRQLVLSGI